MLYRLFVRTGEKERRYIPKFDSFTLSILPLGLDMSFVGSMGVLAHKKHTLLHVGVHLQCVGM